jgi:hypothetical protein
MITHIVDGIFNLSQADYGVEEFAGIMQPIELVLQYIASKRLAMLVSGAANTLRPWETRMVKNDGKRREGGANPVGCQGLKLKPPFHSAKRVVTEEKEQDPVRRSR